jgi:predicted ATPase
MITRLKIDGFKSLVDVDILLGPFTCIAGANAVGKSNLFDALIFLSNLADKTLVEAARTVRSDGRKYNNIRDIFHNNGTDYGERISFEISMLIRSETEDDLGQPAEASITSVQYNLVLRYNENNEGEPIVIEKEELLPISLSEARKNVLFKASPSWKSDVIKGRRTVPFISTNDGLVQIHQEGRGGIGKYKPPKMQRTLLSNATGEYPTSFMVRHEMRSWRMLQLEPAALRASDDFDSRRNAQIASNGAHLAATLYRLHNENKEHDIYQRIANNLSSIISGLDTVSVDKDEKRELLTLQVKYNNGAVFPANTLSDGTLRFLGLAVLELDNTADGVICFEEPENGIHPLKISAIIELLKRIAVDTNYKIDNENPFRQVIINTHSPLVVSIVPEDSLLMADFEEYYDSKLKRKLQKTIFKFLTNTWREKGEQGSTITKGALLKYLNPIDIEMEVPAFPLLKIKHKRVIDRKGIQIQGILNFSEP